VQATSNRISYIIRPKRCNQPNDPGALR
jgi:hypothetical protein